MLELVGYAAKEIAKLEEDVGTQAEVINERGDVHKLLNRAAERAGGDVLSSAHAFRRSFGRNGSGYAIIRESHIPGLSVSGSMKLVSFNLGHVILQQLPHRRRRAVNLNQMKSVRAQVILVAMLAATSFAQSDVDTIIQRSWRLTRRIGDRS